MDETIAKREARRRRILENSERRLQKITGKNNGNECKDISTKCTALDVYANVLELEVNGISVNKGLIQDKNDTLYFQGDNITKNKDKTNIESYFGLNNEDSFVLSNSYKCNDITNDKLDCTNNISNLKHVGYHNESTDYIQEKNSTNYQIQHNVCNKSILSSNLLCNHISYIVLAAIVNILLLFKMDHLFGKYIIIPYFIMMLGRLCARNNIQEPQHGSPLIAALILCNIKPVLTYRLTRAISILTSIITDLALYIFSFTLIYCAITYYLQDFNILIASSM
ncbi:uncharacterized protein LOC122633636 [Vespula pensylvanica]|uniref:uncharacterized protein LOC122633636 n=1 Tax=Vespula pensylvanica TaxID=30213 RepID=UPI001CBA55D2|nr:uncharacterized protein LOC122633636 [Vespula pensylvanica]